MTQKDLDFQIIRSNWLRVVESIDEAVQAAGRPANSVRIIGVTKYVDATTTAWLAQAGCLDLAESRPQSLWEKVPLVHDMHPVALRWHLIGHLQRNKVKRTLPYLHMLHSLDSLRLLKQVDQDAESLGIIVQALLELNVTGDGAKTGLMPEHADECMEEAFNCRHVKLMGLMGMASLDGDHVQSQRDFASLRETRDRLVDRFGPALKLPELSMGMSGDYREAIQEGATIVRIGSALFQSKPS